MGKCASWKESKRLLFNLVQPPAHPDIDYYNLFWDILFYEFAIQRGIKTSLPKWNFEI